MFVDSDDYDIFSEFENGNGRIDLLFKSKKECLRNIIIEIKYSNRLENLQKDSLKALKQIKDKKYYSNLKGRTILLRISHYKKECGYFFEELELH